MSPPEPAICFRELFAYTDYLANRWFAYLTEHEAVLALNLGSQTGTLRNLVEHFVRVEEFFASRLLGQEPAQKPENSGLAGLLRMHKDTQENVEPFLHGCDDDELRDMQMLGRRRVSNQKMLAQASSQRASLGPGRNGSASGGLPDREPQDFILTDVVE